MIQTNHGSGLISRVIPAAILFVAGSFGVPVVLAADVTVTVVGADGAPVEHAAVLLTASSASRPGRQSPVIVDQRDMQYQPWVTAIRRGTGVVFRNGDEITHHVYSFSPAKRLSFRLRAGEALPAEVMDQAGVVVLGCNIHDWMVGYIHVSDADRTAVTGPDGRVVVAGLAAGEWQVGIWHPGLAEATTPAVQTVRLIEGASSELEFRLSAPLRETGPRQPTGSPAYGPG